MTFRGIPWPPATIRARMTLRMAVFVTILVLLTTVATVILHRVDGQVARIEYQDLPALSLLAEIDNRLLRFRIAEVARALSSTEDRRLRSTEIAARRREALLSLLSRFDAFPEVGSITETRATREAVLRYVEGYDQWTRRETDAPYLMAVAVEGEQFAQYQRADAAVRRLFTRTQERASAQIGELHGIVHFGIGLFGAFVVASAVMLWWIRRSAITQIVEPIEQMTGALSRAASGEENVAVPAGDRADEIGALSKVLASFLATRDALDRARQDRATAVAAAEEARSLASAAQLRAVSLERHDPLTGLLNRAGFRAEFGRAVQNALSPGHDNYLLIVDIVDFRSINSIHGQQAGDLVLRETARRVRGCLAGGECLGRLGSDEFAVLVTNAEPGPIRDLAAKICRSVPYVLDLGEGRAQVTVSVGIAAGSPFGNDVDGTLRAAAIALAKCEAQNPGSFLFFADDMAEAVRSAFLLEDELKEDVADGRIEPYFQPIVELESGRVCKFEVLARWTRRNGEKIPPDTFIPAAERLGLLDALTVSVIHRACDAARGLPSDVRISFNISANQLTEPILTSLLVGSIEGRSIDAGRIEIEVTETAMVHDFDRARAALGALRDRGMTVALDDFGTGHAGLQQLCELQFDSIKIDRSFVRTMRSNPQSDKTIDAVIGLAKSLGATVTAEGIEDEEAALILLRKGCSLGQGHWLGRPKPAVEAFEGMPLAAGR